MTVPDYERDTSGDTESNVIPLLAKSTIDATIYVIQQRDPEQLRQWLLKHSPAQRAAIIKFLRGRK